MFRVYLKFYFAYFMFHIMFRNVNSIVIKMRVNFRGVQNFNYSNFISGNTDKYTAVKSYFFFKGKSFCCGLLG